MKAWEIHETFGIENLKLADRADLPDGTIGPREVLIRVSATSLNYRDLLMVRGQYNPRQPLPLIPLSDGVGEVIGVGNDVMRVGIGDRVAGCFIQDTMLSQPVPRDGAHLKRTLGGPLDGMLAQQVLLSEEGVVKVPEHLTDAEAATLPCAALTAWSALVERGKLQSEQTVVVQGTGGVSIFALQIAKALGARVIVTSSSDEKLDHARQLGADETINYRSTPRWSKAVKDLTDHGADHVVEVGGAGTLEQSVRAVCAGGQISVIGILAGSAAPLNILPILMSGIRLQGVFVGSRDEFVAMNEFLAERRLRPVIDKGFAFDEAPEAFEYLAQSKHFGKICLSVE